MILAIKLAEAANHPYSVDACLASGGNAVAALSALVRPQDWTVPAGMPHTHRQCCQYGLPLAELLCVVMRMAENAEAFVAYDFAGTDAMLLSWCATFKLSEKRLSAWTRPGPQRVCVKQFADGAGARIENVESVVAAYNAMAQAGIAA